MRGWSASSVSTSCSIAVEVAQVARRDVRGAARGLDLGLDLVELLLRARDEDRDPAGGGDLQRGGAADARRRAGDDDRLAVDGALEGAVLVEVGIERALPVVPELLGVARERRQRDVGAAQRALGVARVEAAAQRDVLDDLVGDAEVGQHLRADLLERGQLHGEADHALGQVLRRAPVDPHHGLGRVPGLGERVQHVADALALGVDDVEGLAVEAVLMGDVIDHGGDVVDRHDVGPAPLERDQREPLRQRVPDLLDQLEEVVRAVDLVHLAGARVADHDRGPVDPIRRA